MRPFFVGDPMFETIDFFQEQLKQCRDSAEHSTNKNDREFWLKMAERWEGLLKARHPGANVETVQKFRFQRLRFAKRSRAA
jgi:hypothetical protein